MKTVGNSLRAIVLVFLVLGGPVVVVPADEASRPTVARPLLVGNWADPTVLKDGADYYMTHSSFEFQPGLLIWHSKDLRTWRPITHAVVNQEGSIWAPDLIKHGGRFYLYYPAAGTNWVVTADAISGPWSKPVSIGVGHIDPGHIVDDDGRRCVHLSGGHAVEMSPDGRNAVASRPARLVGAVPAGAGPKTAGRFHSGTDSPVEPSRAGGISCFGFRDSFWVAAAGRVKIWFVFLLALANMTDR